MSDNLGFIITDIEEEKPLNAINNMVEMLGDSASTYTDQFKKLEKSFAGNQQRRILGGFAMGTSKDFQAENVILKGVDYSYLNSEQGRVNHNHKSNIIVGRPMYVGMIPDRGLYLKAILREKSDCPNASHPDTVEAINKAEFLWELAKSHSENPGANAPLAFSVEGGKWVDQGEVYKSYVTDVALTERAINPMDCTVKILAKAILEKDQQKAIQTVEQTGFPIDELDDVKSYLAHMSKRGCPLEYSKNLFNQIRRIK